MDLLTKKRHFEIEYYVPNEPFLLLPCNFSITLDNMQQLDTETTTSNIVEKISNRMNAFIMSLIESNSENLTFCGSGSSWSVIILHASQHCMFKINLYRSKKDINSYIIECQRESGDHWLFGGIFQEIKKIYFSSMLPIIGSSIGSSILDDIDDGHYFMIGSSLDDIESMICDGDYQEVLNGIQSISSLCTNNSMLDLICASNILPLLANIILKIDILNFENNWGDQYALKALLNLSNNNCGLFINNAVHCNFGGNCLFNLIKTKLESIELQRPRIMFLSPAKQHILNNSKKLLYNMKNNIIEKRIGILMIIHASHQISSHQISSHQIATNNKIDQFIIAMNNNKKYWAMQILSFI